MAISVLTQEQWLKNISSSREGKASYAAMYSSWFKGIVTDPNLMTVPVDDHLVHRGDGIFEALRFSPKGEFEMQAHLDRLQVSAEMLALKLPMSIDEIRDVCLAVIRASGLATGQLRIFVSRGPGDFSPNPYSTQGSQLYVIAMPFKAMPAAIYEKGAKLVVSKVPVKPGAYARVKSCNYLQNVMTKKESVDRGADFALNVTGDGFVAEGPTENILVLKKNGELLAPPFDYTLRGTTLLRVLQIAESLQGELCVTRVGTGPMTLDDLREAREIMMVGTTLGACPVTWLEGVPVSDGQVGPIAKRLHAEVMKLI